jgi:Holliday junction resolvase RusA-like endonuclease
VRTLFIPSPLPNLNDLIEAAAHSFRTRTGKTIRGVKYRELKKSWAGIIALHARQQNFDPLMGPAHFDFEWLEPTRRRDPDNFVSGGMKLIFDALQEAGLMQNDGWNQIMSMTHTWRVEKSTPGVRITVRV